MLLFWLLAFCGFLFMSLAFVKRHAELDQRMAAGETAVHGRAYAASNAPLLQIFGVATGYCAVVMLAMYPNSSVILRRFCWSGL